MSRPPALVIGEALIDIVCRNGSEPVEHPGGSPLNVAIGLARLGHRATLLTWIGNDARGESIRQHCADSGVRLSAGSDLAPHTSTAQAKLDSSGQATYQFDINWEVPPVPKMQPYVVHTGSIAAILEPGASDVHEILEDVKGTSTISYDPNLRPDIMQSPETTRPIVEHLVEIADIVKVSQEDLEWIYPEIDPLTVIHKWKETGPAFVTVTLGGQGSLTVGPGDVEISVPPKNTPVADTVGAGDAFTAGLLDALWNRELLGHENRERLHGIDPEALLAVLNRATDIAGITVSRPGANPPWLEELPATASGELDT